MGVAAGWHPARKHQPPLLICVEIIADQGKRQKTKNRRGSSSDAMPLSQLDKCDGAFRWLSVTGDFF